MTVIERKVEGRTITLRSINRTLFEFALNHDLLPKSEKFLDNLAEALGATDQNSRVYAATKVIDELWRKYPVLGPSPLLDVLAEFEFSRYFYPAYRDHSCHVLKVYLFGLAAASTVPLLKERIESTVAPVSTELFNAVWLATAVGHDMGYVLETNESEQSSSPAWRKVQDALNSRLKSPLHSTPAFTAALPREREAVFIQTARLFRPQISTAKDIEGKSPKYFEWLEQASTLSALGPTVDGVNSIERYYRFAKSKEVTEGNRPYFLDHGITSALFWASTWNDYHQYITSIVADPTIVSHLPVSVSQKLPSLLTELNTFASHARAIAGAMALHNIDMHLWPPAELASQSFTFDQYQIALQTDHSRGVGELPLAFLLCLSDTIQDWDRPRYSPLGPTSTPGLAAEDVDVNFGSKLQICFYADRARFHDPRDPLSRFTRLVSNLKAFMQDSVLDEILEPMPVGSSGAGIISPPSPSLAIQPSSPPLSKSPDQPLSLSDLAINVENTEYVIGAVNLDEDLHFSSFYLRQSLSANLPAAERGFGYSSIISIYDDFNETYYIPAQECRDVASRLIAKITDDPLWLQDQLQEIQKRSEILEGVFSFPAGSTPFRTMTDYDLLSIYRKHTVAHLRLYEVARIPEALDRGYSTFTEHLKSYLINLHPDLHDSVKLNNAFDALTASDHRNPIVADNAEFINLIERVSTQQADKDAFAGPAKRRRYLRLAPASRRAIEQYRDRWVYWGYHGYGQRALRDLDYYFARISNAHSISRVSHLSGDTLDSSKEKSRDYYCHLYGVSDSYRIIFQLYGRIGAAKIKRRFVQLRNFYFLDQLIAELADRHNVREGLLRSLLPEEVDALLSGTLTLSQSHEARMDHAVWASIDGREAIFTGEDGKRLASQLGQATSRPSVSASDTLSGMPAYIAGKVRGRVRKVHRAGERAAEAFMAGEILVSESTDPDLIEIMEKASAVVTESGGVTSHAMIICRERRIPAIVGVKGVLDLFEDGDWATVDTETGIVRKLVGDSFKYLHFHHRLGSPADVGMKAHRLGVLISQNISVPAFFAVKVTALFAASKGGDGDGAFIKDFWDEISQALSQLGGSMFSLRSSFSNEDGESFSAAGRYLTELLVNRDDVDTALIQMINSLGSSIDFSNGSIIVQEMILGDVSGVLFTSDPIKGDSSSIRIEAVPGSNDLLTSGEITPASFIYNRRGSASPVRIDEAKTWPNLFDDRLSSELISTSVAIESIFERPQDIEWTFKSGRLWILQSRPITTGASIAEASESTLRLKSVPRRNVLSVYRSYRVPPSLQKHMLTVASVAKWIIERWSGPPIDENRILSALLLHDIGNIVKADYRNIPQLFPAEFESLDYWMSIQSWVASRFGKTDVEATHAICEEFGLARTVQELISRKQFVMNIETAESDDFEVKIASYADQRVSPKGVVSLQARIEEAISRYHGVAGASVNSDNRDELVQAAFKIEQQIFQHVNGGSTDQIDDLSVRYYMEDIKGFIIP